METSAPRQQNDFRVIMSSISLEGKKKSQLTYMTKLFESFSFNGSSTLVAFKPQDQNFKKHEKFKKYIYLGCTGSSLLCKSFL